LSILTNEAGIALPSSHGFVEGLNNKIHVIQRRAYGLRDQEYLRLKVLTCMLPAL
jgi:transposase